MWLNEAVRALGSLILVVVLAPPLLARDGPGQNLQAQPPAAVSAANQAGRQPKPKPKLEQPAFNRNWNDAD